jgi:hypothetical protein
MESLQTNRLCMRSPIPEIGLAAEYLNDAATAHLAGKRERAGRLIGLANIKAIRDWTESLWGKGSPYRLYRAVENAPFVMAKGLRIQERMPSQTDQLLLLKRDCHRCRFCGVPVIRAEVRRKLRKFYPATLPWERRNERQHAAFQAMWAQFDHILPHSRGGGNDFENLVVTCAPCNYGRMEHTQDEVGLCDPRTREPVKSDWDGLERLL